MKNKTLLFVAILVFLATSWGVYSHQSVLVSNVKIVVPELASYYDVNDIRSIPVEKIAEDFLRVAFNEFKWEDDFPPQSKGFTAEDYLHGRANPMPEEYKRYILPDRDIPVINTLAKFMAGEIVYINHISPTPEEVKSKVLYKLLPKLKNITGLNLQPINYLQDKSLQQIDILSRHFEGANLFKLSKKSHGHDWRQYQRFFQGAIAFTPEQRAQVDGFILLKSADGSIERSLCYMSSLHDADITQALFIECLLRALGLSQTSQISDNNILGAWNQYNAPYSALYRYEGSKYFRHHGGIIGGDDPNEINSNGMLGTRFNSQWWKEFVRNRKPENYSFPNLTAYDELLLRILYNPRLKPGMTKEEVQLLLILIIKEEVVKIIRE